MTRRSTGIRLLLAGALCAYLVAAAPVGTLAQSRTDVDSLNVSQTADTARLGFEAFMDDWASALPRKAASDSIPIIYQNLASVGASGDPVVAEEVDSFAGIVKVDPKNIELGSGLYEIASGQWSALSAIHAPGATDSLLEAAIEPYVPSGDPTIKQILLDDGLSIPAWEGDAIRALQYGDVVLISDANGPSLDEMVAALPDDAADYFPESLATSEQSITEAISAWAEEAGLEGPPATWAEITAGLEGHELADARLATLLQLLPDDATAAEMGAPPATWAEIVTLLLRSQTE